jgi:uncharacterized protein YeaO (DUF488 family)
MMTLHVKSIFAEPAATDGFRVFVDSQFPAGVAQDAAQDAAQVAEQLDLWLGQIAPSFRLQKWFRDDRDKWESFCAQYYEELDANSTAVTELFQQAIGEKITLLFAAKDVRCNTAVALKAYLEGADIG